MNEETITRVFRALWLADLEAGTPRTLQGYQDLFPTHEALIATQYERVQLDEPSRENNSVVTPISSEKARGGELGEELGPYRILDEIGRGGQAIVYLAEDSRLGRRIALKVLTRLGPGSRSTIERFRREAEVTSRLQHPGICLVHDAGMVDGIPFIAMQYVEGETFASRIARTIVGSTVDEEETFFDVGDDSDEGDAAAGNVPAGAELNELLSIVEKTARALHAAHEADVIHRDIKPGNIMVGADTQPVILDFGLAQNEEETHLTLTRTGDFFGTPAYMSPEQISAHRIRLDRRSDVFSLAVTLYESLTGRRPFEAGSREGLYQAIMTKDPADPRQYNSAISKDLKVILETALEKDRDRRYRTALDFADELRRVRTFEPILARPASPILKLRRWSQRNRGVASMLVLLVIITTAAIVVTVGANSRRERIREEERRAAARDELNERIDNMRRLFEEGKQAQVLMSGQMASIIARIRDLGEEGNERMTELLDSDDPNDRMIAAYKYMYDPTGVPVEAMARVALEDEDNTVSVFASNAMMRAEHPSALTALRRVFENADSEPVRINALFGLLQKGDAQGLRESIPYVESEDSTPIMRSRFIESFALLEGPAYTSLMDATARAAVERNDGAGVQGVLLSFYKGLEPEGEPPAGLVLFANSEVVVTKVREKAGEILAKWQQE